MLATNTQHANEAAARAVSSEPETDAQGRQIMRMQSKPGGTQRKTQAPSEVIASLWSRANDKMRGDWLSIYCALLGSSTEATAAELANMADEAYFEFHARSNPTKFETRG